jgi:CheY-like chemotaxis protein
MASSALRDLRILIVEDEYLIAATLHEALESLGCVVVGPVPSVRKAIQTIASDLKIDGAIVDINLGGALAYPVADALLARKIPFIFTSGYEDDVLAARYPEVKNCHKPYLFLNIQQVLASAISGAGGGSHGVPAG